jgi:hypothetical protein
MISIEQESEIRIQKTYSLAMQINVEHYTVTLIIRRN